MNTKRLLPALSVIFGIILVGCVGLESTMATPSQAGNPAPTEPATLTSKPSSTPIPATTQETPVTETTNPQSPESKPENPLVQQAKEDLANRLSVKLDRINLLEVREVTWPDSSLGCPQPGMAYSQVSQAGLLIGLSVDRDMYFYHSGEDQVPFLCTATSPLAPKVTPKTDELMPPPGSEID